MNVVENWKYFCYQVFCLVCVASMVMVTQSAPFVVPVVSGAITLTVPAVTIPGFGVTVTAASVATALAAKGREYDQSNDQ